MLKTLPMAAPLLLALDVDLSFQRLLPLNELELQDIEAVRMLLRGGSVVDWRRLNFRHHTEVDRFLRLSLFDCKDPLDERRLRSILAQAVAYLRSTFRYRVADAVAKPREMHDLFLLAAGALRPDRYRRIACIVLKVMHCIHHVEARELLFQTPIAELDLQKRLRARVMAVATQMADAGLPIVEFAGNTKTRESLITKLLSKRETLAAQIYDKTRFRVVTERPEDLLPTVHHLANHLFPFNFVVPGQTQNSLVNFRKLIENDSTLRKLIPQLELDLGHERRELKEREAAGDANAFSGKAYRVLNFVVDLPVRLDDLVKPNASGDYPNGRIGFGLVELQIVDAETARRNEGGEASHERYKHRQKLKVLRRLSRGLVVPRRVK